MDKEIWDENTSNIFYRRYVMKQLAELAQMEQMAMQPPQSMASGMPGGQPMPGMQPGGEMPMNPAMGGMGAPTAQPNFGTPPQPMTPPGPPNVEPMPPMPPLSPNLQPLRGRK